MTLHSFLQSFFEAGHTSSRARIGFLGFSLEEVSKLIKNFCRGRNTLYKGSESLRQDFRISDIQIVSAVDRMRNSNLYLDQMEDTDVCIGTRIHLARTFSF